MSLNSKSLLNMFLFVFIDLCCSNVSFNAFDVYFVFLFVARFSEGPVEVYSVFMVCVLPEALVKNIIGNLVKNLDIAIW